MRVINKVLMLLIALVLIIGGTLAKPHRCPNNAIESRTSCDNGCEA